MDLTTLARVKTLLFPWDRLDYDNTLAQLITDVSGQVESALNRGAESIARTEYFSPEPGQQVFGLKGYPVASVASVKEDVGDRAFTTDANTIDAELYTTNSDTGALYLHGWACVGAHKSLQVVYTGGMAATTAAFLVAFPDLAAGVDAQVAFMLKRRDSIGFDSIGSAGSSSALSPLGFVQPLQDAIERHRRVSICG